MNDHDLLVRIDERTQDLEKTLCNHLKTHSRANIAAYSTAVGAILALIILLFKLT